MTDPTPTTRPSETARIHKIAEDAIATNRELLTGMAILMDRSEQSRNWQEGSDEWRANHDRNDAASFAEIRGDIVALKSSVGAVTSSANTEQLNSRYTLKELVVGFLVLCTAVGGLIAFIGSYVSGGPKP